MSDNELEKQNSPELTRQKRLFSFLFDKSVPPLPTDEERKIYPERKSNPISQLMFLWIFPILKVGYKRTLQYDDCFKMDDAQKVSKLYQDFNKNFEKCKNGNNTKITKLMLLKAVYLTLFWEWWIGFTAIVCANVGSTLSTLLLKNLSDFVEYSTEKSHVHYGKGVGYAIGCSLLLPISGILMNYAFYRGVIIGTKIRCIFTRVLIEKSFTIDAFGFHKFPASKINAIMSADLSRLDMSLTMILVVSQCFVPITISIALLIVDIGVSALAGIACCFLLFIGIGVSFKALVKLRESASFFTDKRVKLTRELLQNFKMIKLYSWETAYLKWIEDTRNQEIKSTLTMQTLKNILTAFIFTLPNLSAMIAFLAMSRVSPNRSAGDIFAAFALFQTLAITFFNMPAAISGAANLKVTFQRISEFLSYDDLKKENYEIYKLDDNKIAIEVDNADFQWANYDSNNADSDDNSDIGDINDEKLNNATLHHNKDSSLSTTESSTISNSYTNHIQFNGLKTINFQIFKGELILVAGAIGTGKTSLLHALSGSMKRIKGKVMASGDYILCSNYWIKNDSIRSNIIFGLPFDKDWYNLVVNACCLVEDFTQFDGGDLTEVGERGITLSGGQKARICLARSIYVDKDIYYLDDVLSAVDAKVGKHIVEHCICGLLSNKTVILATHHIDLVDRANRVIFLNGDGTLEIGKIEELKSTNLNAKKFFNKIEINKLNLNEPDHFKNEKVKEDVFKITENNSSGDKMIKIIGDEERAVNGISFAVYKDYYTSGVGAFKLVFLPILLLLILFATFLSFFTNVWLSYWIDLHFGVRTYGFYAGLYIMFNLLCSILSGFEFTMFGYFCVTASKNLNLNAIRRLVKSPVAFMDVTPLGRVLNRFTKDTDILDNEMVDQLRMAIYPISLVVGCFILCIIYLPWFAIAIPIIFFAYIFLSNYYQASSRELRRIDALRRSFVFTHFNESLEGLDTIKAYHRKDDVIIKLDDLIDNHNEAYFLTCAIQRWIGGGFSVIAFIFILIISLLCCFRVFGSNGTSTGLLLSYALTIPNLVSLAIRSLAQIETEFNSVERLNYYSKHLIQEAAYEKPETDPSPNSWPLNGEIIFQNVSLKYRPDLPYVINDLSLSIKGGEKIGFCGRTGAGKSTFMTCLYRLAEYEGCITIDGINIQHLGLHILRSNMSIIPQDPVLFVGTIRSNLDPFDEYNDDQLWDVLVEAGLIEREYLNRVKIQTKKDDDYHKFHLNRDVETDGSNFSLGERQLIALARALIRKSKILILDEATSSVDYITDAKIQRTISTQFKNCTILSIAHRLETILLFDKIVVMDEGKIVQFDTPKNLFKDKTGLFRILCSQSGIDESRFV